MIALGRTWSNLMVDVVATNAKLRGRVVRILREATGVDEESAQQALAEAGGELKPALLNLLTGVPAEEARSLLDAHGGSVAAALGAIAPTALEVRVTVVVGVDVGGSGLRCRSVVDGVRGPSVSGAGLRIGPPGIDVARSSSPSFRWSRRPDSSSGPCAACSRSPTRRRSWRCIRERVGAREVWVCGDALAAMVGAVGSVRPAASSPRDGAVAFATDFDRIWRRVDGWGHILGDRGRRPGWDCRRSRRRC
jgi:hypothetical protein